MCAHDKYIRIKNEVIRAEEARKQEWYRQIEKKVGHPIRETNPKKCRFIGKNSCVVHKMFGLRAGLEVLPG